MAQLKELTSSQCGDILEFYILNPFIFFVISLQSLENNIHGKYYVLNTQYISTSKTNIHTMTETYIHCINTIKKPTTF